MNQNKVIEIRKDFPTLDMKVHGKDLIFLDTAASSLKPRQVSEAVANYYQTYNSNVHRGSYKLSQMASKAFDDVRKLIQTYINASSEKEIIFTKGTTEAINLLAYSLGNEIQEGDEVIVTEMEHHANIVPWQRLCEEKKAQLRVTPINDDGSLNLEAIKELLNEKSKILAITHMSNVLGTINPLKEIIEVAHRYDTKVVVDGAQGIVHGKVDVKDLDCDFYCFSGHKFYAPMGTGVLYGKSKWLEEMPPYQVGGAMIDKVSFEKTTYKSFPNKFEAGTPNVGGVIGLGEAIKYVEQIGWKDILTHEDSLRQYAELLLNEISGMRIIGQSINKGAITSFVIDGIHSYDIGTLLDRFGVSCRAGNHCTQPLHEVLGISGTVRASFAYYNMKEEIEKFVDALKQIVKMLR